MSIDLQLTTDKLRAFGQQHLLDHAGELSESQLSGLIADIDAIDLQMINDVLSKSDVHPSSSLDDDTVTPPLAFRLTDSELNLYDENVISREQAINRGHMILSEHKLGVIVVAGGQGTRLGFNHPKGMYPLGALSNRSLFQFVTDKVNALSDLYGYRVPLFIMTSPPVHDETVEYFAEHDNFDLADQQLFFFCQGTMPAVDKHTGKILLQSPGQIGLSPNGHGGMLSALKDNGILKWCGDNGITTLFYSQIDNPLSQIGDPLLLGLHDLANADVSMQVIEKQNADDRTGNVVSIDGKTQMIEYSEMPAKLASQTITDSSGTESLRFWASNIAVHVFSTDFLSQMSENSNALPFHLASKKVPYWFSNEVVEPQEPNAFKFEQFIFDLLPHAKNTMVVEVDRSHAFAPVKNGPQESFSTAATSQATMNALYHQWLAQAGVDVDESVIIEINARFAMDSNQLLSNSIPDYIRDNTYFE